MSAVEDYYEMCKHDQIQELKYTGLTDETGGNECEYFKGDQILEGILYKLEENVDGWFRCDNSNVYWIPTFEDLLLIYMNEIDETEFGAILDFSNFVISLMEKRHDLGLLFPTKEMLAIVFIMEKVYNYKSEWYRNKEYALCGGWEYQVSEDERK